MLDLTIPVYNEELSLNDSLVAVLRFLSDAGLDRVRLTIADNGSTDRTRALGEAFARADERVSYLQVGKKGVGLALKTAWSAAEGEFVGYMDLDLATDLKHLNEAHSLLLERRYDLVVGSRRSPGSEVVGRSALRSFASWGFNSLLRLALDVRFMDGMCGFKFLKREAFEALMYRYSFTDEWFFATEILVKSEWAGMRVREIPVRWVDAPDSKVKMVETIVQYLGDIRRLREERAAGR